MGKKKVGKNKKDNHQKYWCGVFFCLKKQWL